MIDELILEPEEHREVRGATSGSARISFRGNPGKVTHLVIGDSNIKRIGELNLYDYDLYEEAVAGLVLVHDPGGMGRFSGLVKQITRLLHNMYTDSFEDASNTVQIAICFGYNDPEMSIREYFRDSIKVLMEFKHAYSSVAARIEVQLGEILYGKSSLHSTHGHRNFIHYQLSRVVGRVKPLRLWAGQLAPELPENGLKPVNATNIDLRIRRDTLSEDMWHHNDVVINNTRDVVLDWCRGVVTAGDVYPSQNVYRYLRDFEVYLPGSTMTVDQDVFSERNRVFVQHVVNPLDETVADQLDKLPRPVMRLDGLTNKVKPRPTMQEERDSVHNRVDLNYQQGGQASFRAGEARGARGARGGRGRGAARGGRVRFQPYNKGW